MKKGMANMVISMMTVTTATVIVPGVVVLQRARRALSHAPPADGMQRASSEMRYEPYKTATSAIIPPQSSRIHRKVPNSRTKNERMEDLIVAFATTVRIWAAT